MHDFHVFVGLAEVPESSSVEEATEHLVAHENADISIYCEVGPTLTVLLNPQRAFVMWIAQGGDAGKHAVDSDTDGSDEHEFTLANGQVDEFSAADTVSREAALEAVAHFLKTREASPRLAWRED